MFERYTEKARRVIFYARYEASQFGTPEIETEHLLLGLLKESPTAFSQILQTPIDADVLRARMRQNIGLRPSISTSVDLPLTNASKHVLAYAAEEAERFGHSHIGTEHLLLGLLREEKSLAALVLREHGASLKQARRQLEQAASRPDERGAMQGSVRGWGTGSGGAPPTPNIRLIAEDGLLIHEVFWTGRFVRIPSIGEAITLEHAGSKVIYRVLDVAWHVVKTGETHVNTGHVVLKVRAEDSPNSSPPSPKI